MPNGPICWYAFHVCIKTGNTPTCSSGNTTVSPVGGCTDTGQRRMNVSMAPLNAFLYARPCAAWCSVAASAIYLYSARQCIELSGLTDAASRPPELLTRMHMDDTVATSSAM